MSVIISRSTAVIALLLAVWNSKPVDSIYETCPGKTMLKSGGLSCEDRRVILDAHNKLRQKVASGRVNRQPPASDMKEMVWDEELAHIAQKWADHCQIAHDSGRNVARFDVGQNIASTWTTATTSEPTPDFPKQVKAWFDEVQKYSYGPTKYSPATGHYTQVIWAETNLVGCGYSYYYDSSRGYTKLYVCNYGPGGNIIGVPPYSSGQSLTCKQSTRFHGLCETTEYPQLGYACAGAPQNYETETNDFKPSIVQSRLLLPTTLQVQTTYQTTTPASTTNYNRYSPSKPSWKKVIYDNSFAAVDSVPSQSQYIAYSSKNNITQNQEPQPLKYSVVATTTNLPWSRYQRKSDLRSTTSYGYKYFHFNNTHFQFGKK